MSAMIDGIPNIAPPAGITNAIQAITPPVRQVKDSAFGSLFTGLIQNVKDTDTEFTQAQYLLATGQLENPVQLGIAAYKNEIAVDLLIQMRNKALDAYNELKNMSV